MVVARFLTVGLCVVVMVSQVVVGIPLLQKGSSKMPEQTSSFHHFHQSLERIIKIEFQDLNFIQLTDVHSWLSGHAHENKIEAGYPDVLAFVQHLQQMAWKEGKDVFLFNSGDIVDGTGLSDATQVRGVLITPIIEQMPFTALTCGNHELYHNSTITNLAASGFVSHWDGHYLTANIHNATTGELIGSPYTIVRGKMGRKLLVMGFLYNMENSCEAVTVQKVADALQEPWFEEAMAKSKEVDAIVALVHMDAKDPLTHSIRAAIREKNPEASVVFLAGHTHIREFATLDERSVSLESGKFLDTVGFVACSLPAGADAPLGCDHAFVTPHVATFMALTGTDGATFETPAAKKMRADIDGMRAKLGLDEVIGCSPTTWKPSVSLADKHSMWSLYVRAVLPAALYPENPMAVFVGSTGALRYTLYEGEVHLDDTYIVAPFKDIFYISHIAGEVMAKLIDALLKREMCLGTARSSDKSLQEYTFPWVASVDPRTLHDGVVYDLVFVQFDGVTVEEEYKKLTGEALAAAPFRSSEVDSRSVWEAFIRQQWPGPCAQASQP